MTRSADRPFDWIAALAVFSGAAVMIPALAVLVITLLAVAMAIFQ